MGAFRRKWPGLSYGRGEDWHYVGEAGEPAFEADFSNAGSGIADLAFRLREAGVVDVIGVIDRNSFTPTVVCTFPEGYRPATGTSGFFAAIYVRSAVQYPVLAQINDSGALTVGDTTTGDRIYLNGSFFLNPASTP